MAGRDITEGRATRAIAVDLGIGTGTIWQNTGVAYDVAIAGIPFFLAENNDHPYERSTAQFRKQQFDSQRDPGEQSLTGWWLRSQSSFHGGEGITFYDPFANPYSTTLATNSYRVKSAYGVNIWEPGHVTLLRDLNLNAHGTTTAIGTTYGRPYQSMFPAKWSTKEGFILHDGYDLDRIDSDGTVEHWVDYNTGTADPVYAACTDGSTMYWITNDTVGGKMRMEKKEISASTSTAATTMWTVASGAVSRATVNYVKQRIVLAANNKIYEFPVTQSSAPTAIYTHPITDYVYSSITESGTAIYVSGYYGLKSSIFKFTLDTAGAMPTLTAPITAAEMPYGEIVHKIYTYLGYMMIGTNKGIRVASIDNAGSITYGPLIETPGAVYDFTARDRFIWATTGVTNEEGITEAGLTRIDLSVEIDNLRFAYAHDVHYDTELVGAVTACTFMGDTDRIAFCTAATTSANGQIFLEDATRLRTDGYVETGLIRYNTLEQKNFKRLVGHGLFDYGSLSLQTVDVNGNVYDVNSYDAIIGSPESRITEPVGAQDAIGLRFRLYRDATDNTKGPDFRGYQLKAVPASPRTRMITAPLMNYDYETDKYNVGTGYENRAIDRLFALEDAEAAGDVVTWQDFRTGETVQCLIEEVVFVDTTPPDKRLTGFGGTIKLTIRTV